MTYIGCPTNKDIKLLCKIGIPCWCFTNVDDIIDRIRKKYNVIIYHKSTPFVAASGKIIYNCAAKSCNPKMGWNGRTYIDTPSTWDSNIYEAKRRAIRAAAQWILAHKCKKVSIKLRKNERSKKAKD